MIFLRFLISLILINFILVLPAAGIAKEILPIPTSTPKPTSQSSYELFYPVVAGKTEGESGYVFKLIRDRIIEIMSLGNIKKSEATLKIATKRLLEAEKLVKGNKNDVAKKTLSKFNTKLAASYDFAIASKDNEQFVDLMTQIQEQTAKYLIVLNQLKETSNSKGDIEEAIQRVTDIQNKISGL